MNLAHNKIRRQSGFTLVELAIVMIIIGLLIGGVLKGQQLVNDAQVTATVAQIKSIQASIISFQDMYGALPGDIQNPAADIPNCANVPTCTIGGNANGILDNITPGNEVEMNTEAAQFFVHLFAAGLIDGIDPDLGLVYGGFEPLAKIPACGIRAGYSVTGQVGEYGPIIDSTGMSTGLYLTMTGGVPGAGIGCLTAHEAQSIDYKIDDGSPSTGSARGATGFGAGVCGTAGPTGVYDETNGRPACELEINIQN